jgi:hypothetical protein
MLSWQIGHLGIMEITSTLSPLSLSGQGREKYVRRINLNPLPREYCV